MAETNIQDMDENSPRGSDLCDPQSIRDLKQSLINQFSKHEEPLTFDGANYARLLDLALDSPDPDTLNIKYKAYASSVIFSGNVFVSESINAEGEVSAIGNILAFQGPSISDPTNKKVNKPVWKYLNDQSPKIDSLAKRARKALNSARELQTKKGGS